jgi:hypothetical protein
LKSKIQEVEDWRNRRFQEVKVIWSRRLKHLKMDKDLKFGDSTRVCNSNWVSGATDMDMPFGYLRISIPGSAHYGGGLEQGL